MNRGGMHVGESIGVKIAERALFGLLVAPGFEVMRDVIDETQSGVAGDVRLKLYRGSAVVVGRRAPHSLYNERLATFEAEDIYNQRDAEGFIKLNALRLRLRGLSR